MHQISSDRGPHLRVRKTMSVRLFLLVISAIAVTTPNLHAADKPNALFITIAELSHQMWTALPAPPKLQPQKHQKVATKKTKAARPNIVFCMADDWSWPHASVLGDPVVTTPNFDRVATEGVLFENAFVSTPSCTPSRLSILTGQHHWRLREGDSLGGSLREEYPVYTEMLQKAGYRIGRFGKGVWPSKHTFRNRDSFGEKYRSFDDFIQERKTDEPFCYWHGGQDPHRPYELGIGEKSGMNLSDVKVPACLPDNATVRSDVADYHWEVQRFDREVGQIITKLESIGELENTIIVVSGDNGMPFPRCKATLYDQGTRVPLAIRWGAKTMSNRRVSDFTSLCDLAPTFLEAAGITVPKQMTGRSLLTILKSSKSGQIDPKRTFALTGMERHVYSYPSRAIRTKDFLYIRNFSPEDWPTGEVEGKNPEYDFATMAWPTEKGAFSFNIDPGPAKQYLRLHREDTDVQRHASLSFGKHPEEELYDLSKDPEQLHNVANDRRYQSDKQRLRRQLDAELITSDDPRLAVDGYSTRTIEGWPVRVSDRLMRVQSAKTLKAIELLAGQLKTVIDVVPAKALKGIRSVPIWLSPEYDGVRPTAEYHPSGGWLQRVGRHPELAECVELTNINIFERECQRMPMMILHELAHAYHHQVLGFDDARIKAGYERAVASGSYEAVERNNGNTERAYGMNNHKEYFAESSEAFFGTNDFFPFNRVQLKQHDPRMFELVQQAWEFEKFNSDANSSSLYPVKQPPTSLGVSPFYAKYVDASGYPIVASTTVNDFALKEAAYLVDMLLLERPDIRRAMVASGSRMIVMGHDELTTDIPQHSHLRPKDFWDARARGLGGSRDDPVCSCGEENLLGFEGDPYSTENILIHEFAHNIHLRGLVNLDPTFDARLKQTYERAMAAGLWKKKYASTNHQEYFAEGVQSWFDNNRQPDHDHNHVDTRIELKEYDPDLAAICKEVFGDTKFVYTKPASRLTGHLTDYTPSKAARFEWPARLKKAKKEIHESVTKRGSNRQPKDKN